MKRTDKSVDNIQPLEIHLETGWHVTKSHSWGFGAGRGQSLWIVDAVLGPGDVKRKACLITYMREVINGAVGRGRGVLKSYSEIYSWASLPVIL